MQFSCCSTNQRCITSIPNKSGANVPVKFFNYIYSSRLHATQLLNQLTLAS